MLKAIWECSSSSLTEDVADSHFFDALRLIDGHLASALEGDEDWRRNLAPYDDDSKSEQTYYKMMENLLLGPAERLAEKRVEAIKEGRSAANYFESLLNGTESKEAMKPKIDEEVKVSDHWTGL